MTKSESMHHPAFLFAVLIGGLLASLFAPAQAGPNYEFDRHQLEAMMADLRAWLPGAWDSYPQVWYERNVALPADGEHEHWHRTFALIDAPQVGDTVFYGQINIGGRDGPIMTRSQVLYKAVIDKQRDVIAITGQSPAEPEKFENLHERPELWGEVRMRDEAAVNCDFIWRRDGRQLVGVLDGKTDERRKHGPGTCSYIAGSGAEFFADAEWVLTPEELWLYDINKMRGVQFIGRADRTHIRLYRARSYQCELRTADDVRTLAAHDRGFSVDLQAIADQPMQLMLLRAWFPAADGGLDDQLRLILTDPVSGETVASVSTDPLADQVELNVAGITADCRIAPP